MPRGFVSVAQWRWAYATHQTFAHKEAHKAQAVGGGPIIAYHKLPGRKSIRRKV
jgi:hypothetical protein